MTPSIEAKIPHQHNFKQLYKWLSDAQILPARRKRHNWGTITTVWSSPREPDTPTMGDESPRRGVRLGEEQKKRRIRRKFSDEFKHDAVEIVRGVG